MEAVDPKKRFDTVFRDVFNFLKRWSYHENTISVAEGYHAEAETIAHKYDGTPTEHLAHDMILAAVYEIQRTEL